MEIASPTPDPAESAPQRPGPALSATSDAPDPNRQVDAPPIAEEVVGGLRTVPQRDAAGKFVKADKGVDEQNAPFKPDPTASADEPAAGDKKAAEDTGADKKPRKPETDPAVSAAFARRDAEIATLKAQVAQLTAPKPPEPQPRPRWDQFQDPADYDKAVEEWARAEGAREAAVKAAEDRTKAEQRSHAEAVVKSWNERMEAFEADHPDFREVIGASDLRVSQAMTVAIANVENGPAVAYHLGKDKAEAARIAAMDPMRAAVEIGRLAADLAKPAQSPARRLPNPPPNRGSRSSDTPASDAELSPEAYAAKHAERLRWNAHN